EVTRYLGRFGSDRIIRAVLISALPPFLLQTPDNPEGLPSSLFDGFLHEARHDTPAWMAEFLERFYNFEKLRGTLVSDQAYHLTWAIAVSASATAAVASIATWETDFRADLPKITVPVLVIHGDEDRVLPHAKTARRLPGLIKDLQLVTIDDGPHAIAWTHSE